MQAQIDADLQNVFFEDFGVEVSPTTWGTRCFTALFDRGYVEFNGASSESPYLTMRRTDLPTSYAEGDLFTIRQPGKADEFYKLMDVQYSENDLVTVPLADVA